MNIWWYRIPHKSIRKVIKAGESSYAVILPRSWIRFHELDHGDYVEVISNGSVMIKSIQKGGESI